MKVSFLITRIKDGFNNFEKGACCLKFEIGHGGVSSIRIKFL